MRWSFCNQKLHDLATCNAAIDKGDQSKLLNHLKDNLLEEPENTSITANAQYPSHTRTIPFPLGVS